MGMVARYLFNGTLEDHLNKRALVKDNVQWGDGKLGPCISFTEDVNAPAVLEHNASAPLYRRFLKKRDNFSVSVWLKVSDFTAYSVVFGQPNGDAYSNESIGLWVTGSNRLGFVIGTHRDSNPAGGVKVLQVNAVPLNKTVNLILVKDGNRGRVFLNGVKVVDEEVNITLDHLDLDYPFIVGGGRVGRPGERFKGCVEDLVFYDHPLSFTEITNLSRANIFDLKIEKSTQVNRQPHFSSEILRGIPVANRFLMATQARVLTGYNPKYLFNDDLEVTLRCNFELFDTVETQSIFGAGDKEGLGHYFVVEYGQKLGLYLRGHGGVAHSVEVEKSFPSKAEIEISLMGTVVTLIVNGVEEGSFSVSQGEILDLSDKQVYVGGINLDNEFVSHGRLKYLEGFSVNHAEGAPGGVTKSGYAGSLSLTGTLVSSAFLEGELGEGYWLEGRNSPKLRTMNLVPNTTGVVELKSASTAYLAGPETTPCRLPAFTFATRLTKTRINNWHPLFSIGRYFNNSRSEGWSNKTLCFWFNGVNVQICTNIGMSGKETRTPLEPIPIGQTFSLGVSFVDGILKVYVDGVVIYNQSNRGTLTYPPVEETVLQVGGVNVYSPFEGKVDYLALTPNIHDLEGVTDYENILRADVDTMFWDTVSLGGGGGETGFLGSAGTFTETNAYPGKISILENGVNASHLTEVY